MCVPIEHPFPSINPARTGTGPCGGDPPTRPCRPIPALRPRVPRVRGAPPEYRLRALGRREPPVVAQDGPQLRVHPSFDHVVGRRQRAGLSQGGVEVGEQRPRRYQRRQRRARPPQPLVGIDSPAVHHGLVLREVGPEPAPVEVAFLGRRSVLSLKASKRSAREFRGASCLPNANSVQGKSELSLEGSGKRDSCLTNSLERDKKTGAPELNAGCGHLSSSVQNQAAAYPSSRRPTFDGGRAAGMGTGSNAGSRCHGRPRLSNPGQPFS